MCGKELKLSTNIQLRLYESCLTWTLHTILKLECPNPLLAQMKKYSTCLNFFWNIEYPPASYKCINKWRKLEKERENKIQTSKLLLERYSVRFVPRIGMVWSLATLTFARNERKSNEARVFFFNLFIYLFSLENHYFIFLFWC